MLRVDVERVSHSGHNPHPRPIPGGPAAIDNHPAVAARSRALVPGPRTPEPDEAVARLARLAHELSNLLDGSMRTMNIVLGNARSSPSAPADTLPELDRRLRSVQTALEQMTGMVAHAMRGTGMVRSGRARQPGRDLTLFEACEHAVAILEPLAQRAGAEVRVQVDDEARGLPADIAYTIVANGVRNALESIMAATGEGKTGREGVVFVRAAFVAPDANGVGSGPHGTIVLEISDNGVGPPPAPVAPPGACLSGESATQGGPVTPATDARLFTPGFSTKAGGSGIGLALCSELLQERGGSIRLRAGDGGVGATLRAAWPAGVVGRG
ncbi:MAG: sensor histidine kinase [Phycisphaerales bacterium]